MTKLSANLGFLWTDLSLVDAVHAAKKAGFQAVECHFPYTTPPADLRQALADTGLPMIGLNTARGDVDAGDNGVAAVTGREQEAREYIDQAIEYANAIDCPRIHVMAGNTDGSDAAEAVFRKNLSYASRLANQHHKVLLIEPLNQYDAPGYHVSTVEAAVHTINALAEPAIKVMFDCYHVQIMQGDLVRRLTTNLAHIGHIQIASVPDRGEPGSGEVNYPWLLREIDTLGWAGYIGAEYRPAADTGDSLAWMDMYKPAQ